MESESESRLENAYPAPELEAMNYGGIDYTGIVQKTDTQNVLFCEIDTESMNGDTVNDAIFLRNSILEEKYNIHIHAVEQDFRVFSSAVRAGDDAYQFSTPSVITAFNWAVDGLTLNLTEIPHLQFDMPWWNQNAITEGSILNKSYFAVGAMNLLAYEATGVLFFNKELIKAYDLKSPYDMVLDGTWTFDNMMTLGRSIAGDVDGDGDYDENDRYGIALNSYGALTFSYGAGANFAPKNEQDIPSVIITENFITFFQKFVSTVSEDTSVMYGERFGDQRVTVMQSAFEEGRLLFYNEMLNRTTILRNLDLDYGILPMPKADEFQNGYQVFTHQGNSSTMVLPVTSADYDRDGRIMEDMAYYSLINVRPAYVDTAIKTKYLRDESSAQMVDIIIDSMHFDISLLSNLALVNDLRSYLTNGNENIASAFASKAAQYEKALQKTVEKIAERE
ncbi:MAG: hypothetical protein J6I50_03080 [Clostridia bacterium]|nr:hypothetical protein [Clostridia bacterium]